MERCIELTNIEELAEVYHLVSNSQYRGLIKALKLSDQMKDVFLNQQDSLRFVKNVEKEKAALEVNEDKFLALERERTRSEIALIDAQNKLQWARKVLKEAEEEVKRQKERRSKILQEKEHCEQLICEQRKRLEQMSRYLLVHPTGSIRALDKKRNKAIVCTLFDKKRMRFKRFADCIIDTTGDEFEVEKSILQDEVARGKFSSEEEFASAVQYVKLVVQYDLEDKPYELLYNSEGIKYLLGKILG